MGHGGSPFLLRYLGAVSQQSAASLVGPPARIERLKPSTIEACCSSTHSSCAPEHTTRTFRFGCRDVRCIEPNARATYLGLVNFQVARGLCSFHQSHETR